MAEPYIGEIIMVGFNFAPRGFAFCDGSLLSIAQNTALFSILGTTFGGDGRTTFGLPDLRSRVPLHPGNGAGLPTYRLGEKTGRESETMTAATMPSHAHDATPPCHDTASDAGSPGGNYPGLNPNGNAYSPATNAAMAAYDSESTGNAAAIDIRQPTLTINYCIALVGVFPSRN